MFSIFRKLLEVLTKKERRQFYALFFVVLILAMIETAGIVSIMPFMAVVASPEVIQTNQWLNWVYTWLGFTSDHKFLIFLGFVVLGVLVFSNALKLAVSWLQVRYMKLCNHSLSTRLLNGYLRQPYDFFLNRNTSEMGKNIIEEAAYVTHNILAPTLNICTKALVTLCIVGLLVAIDPMLALAVFVVLGTAYSFVFALVRMKLSKLGQRRLKSNVGRFQTASEALAGVKELKVLGREGFFFDRYAQHSKSLAKIDATSHVISASPAYAMESLAFGGILLIVIYFLMVKGSLGQVLPLLALYAFAGYRLLPALQQIFHGITQVRFCSAVLDTLHKDLLQFKSVDSSRGILEKKPEPAIHCRQGVHLNDISYVYPGNQGEVLSGVSLHIPARKTTGFVGSTGSGKTTLIDILLGLLVPVKGTIRVDGLPLSNGNRPAWQRIVGYVPQSIYLVDDTVANNIALGIHEDCIDLQAVERAASMAKLDRFVAALPQGFQTLVGDRGVRLSGGERQRIAIARALYHDPEVLILDEATSALDGATENEVMQAVNALARKKTIVMVAHRLSTVMECDAIHVMEHGRIIATGSYQELMDSCPTFQRMSKTFSN